MISKFNSKIKISVFLFLALLVNCADNEPVNYRIKVEQQYLLAEKEFMMLLKSRPKDKEKKIEALVKKFSDQVDFSFEALDSLKEYDQIKEISEIRQYAYQGSLRLTQLYFSQKRFDESIKTLRRLLDKSRLKEEALVQVYINLGQALHSLGKFDSAINIYENSLKEIYPPMNKEGEIIYKLFNLPLHIFQTYHENGENVISKFAEAKGYYLDLLEGKNDSVFFNSCYANLAVLYSRIKDYEKEIEYLWKINESDSKQAQKLRKKIADIYAQNIRDYDRSLELIEQLLLEVEFEDSLFYPRLLLDKSLIFQAQKRSFDSRQVLVEIKKKYPHFFRRTPAAQQLMAQTFDADNNWNRAEIEYNLLVEQAPYSNEALATYIYLSGHYESVGRKTESRKWINLSKNISREMIHKGRGTALELRGILFLADLYSNRKEWSKAVTYYLEIYKKFPETKDGRKGLGSAIEIYSVYIKDELKADSLREIMLKNLPAVKQSLEF